MQQTAAPQGPAIPPGDLALFLDFDGTLVEIAPRPDLIVVPPSLPVLLAALRDRLHGAVALISGRPLFEIEGFLPGLNLPMVGEHGAIGNQASGLAGETLPVPDAGWIAEAQALADRFPGALLERKRHGLVLHFRGAPAALEPARDLFARMAAEQPAEFRLVPALAAMELRPVAVDKGAAVRRLMATSRFAGRTPFFIGDDVTDRDGIAAAADLGGGGWLVPDAFPQGPQAVHHWLGQVAKG